MCLMKILKNVQKFYKPAGAAEVRKRIEIWSVIINNFVSLFVSN